MSRTNGPWHQSDNPDRVARNIGGRAAIWTVAALLFFGLLGVGVWGFQVVTSDPKGRGDATITKNEAGNRIRAQEGFEKVYADIVASDRKIDVADAAVKADPGDRTLRQNATGIRSYCLSVVADYNARARSFTSADFRDADLPYQIDNSDPATDCKGSTER